MLGPMARLVNLADVQQFAAINLTSDPGHVAGPVVVPSCAKIILHWLTEDGKGGNNVLFGRYSGAFSGSVTQANAIMTALSTGAQWTALAAFFAGTGGLNYVQILDVNTPNNTGIQSIVSGSTGSSASPALPNEVALVGTLRTAKTGPQNRGRMFVPGWATNALGAGNVAAAAAVTAYGNWLATITGALAGSGYTWVIGQPHRAAYTSPKTGRVFPERLATSTVITSAVVRDNHWDTQRRRGLK